MNERARGEPSMRQVGKVLRSFDSEVRMIARIDRQPNYCHLAAPSSTFEIE
jgi:hypothetical protein